MLLKMIKESDRKQSEFWLDFYWRRSQEIKDYGWYVTRPLLSNNPHPSDFKNLDVKWVAMWVNQSCGLNYSCEEKICFSEQEAIEWCECHFIRNYMAKPLVAVITEKFLVYDTALLYENFVIFKDYEDFLCNNEQVTLKPVNRIFCLNHFKSFWEYPMNKLPVIVVVDDEPYRHEFFKKNFSFPHTYVRLNNADEFEKWLEQYDKNEPICWLCLDHDLGYDSLTALHCRTSHEVLKKFANDPNFEFGNIENILIHSMNDVGAANLQSLIKSRWNLDARRKMIHEIIKDFETDKINFQEMGKYLETIVPIDFDEPNPFEE